MRSNLIRLLRLARLSGNHDAAPDRELADYMIGQLEKPTTPIGRLSPLLLNNLEHLEDSNPELLRRLRFATGIIRQLWQLQQQWLHKALELLSTNGIEVILLKAAAFNGAIYPPATPRIGSDLDLLVRPGDYDRACALLATLFEPEPVPENEKATARELWETSFRLPQNLQASLDLHRELGSSLLFPISTAALFERSIPHPGHSPELVRCLSPVDQLIHLAVHAARDLSLENHNLLDAHELWSHYEPDSEQLLRTAQRAEARNALFLLLKTCSEELDTAIRKLSESKTSRQDLGDYLMEVGMRLKKDPALDALQSSFSGVEDGDDPEASALSVLANMIEGQQGEDA